MLFLQARVILKFNLIFKRFNKEEKFIVIIEEDDIYKPIDNN